MQLLKVLHITLLVKNARKRSEMKNISANKKDCLSASLCSRLRGKSSGVKFEICGRGIFEHIAINRTDVNPFS